MAVTTNKQEIILNDSSVAALSELSLKTIESIGGHFKCLPVVHIHETIHGHIAQFTMEHEGMENWLKKPKEEWCKTPFSLSMDDLEFLGDMSNLRYINLTNSQITFAFRN